MSCGNQSNQNWDQTFNQSFSPNQSSTPRRGSPQNASGYSQMKPQRLYSTEQYPPRSKYPYTDTPKYNRSQFPGQAPQSPSMQAPYRTAQQRVESPQRSQVYTRKVIYETSNLPPQPNYSQFGPDSYYQSQQPCDGQYGTNQTYSQPTPTSSYYPAPRSNSQSSTSRKRSSSPAKQNKQGCQPCPSSQDRINKLFKEYMEYLETLVTHALIRRKRMRAVIAQTIKWTEESLDCKEKRSQKRAKTQMDDNLHQEVIVIYTDLMNRRKHLHHETRSSRSSLVSINARRKKTPVSSAMNQKDLEDDEKELVEEFIKIVADTINAFSERDIELSDEFTALADGDCDCDTLSSYQQDYQREMEALEEEFISIWEQYEQDKCTCADNDDDDEEDPMLIEIGNTIQEVLLQQYKLQENLERKLADECTDCMSSRGKNFPHSDRLELHNIDVDMINDLWYALDMVKTILIENDESASSNDNYVAIFRVVLAIYRKCLGQVKDMIQEHYKKRRAHQVENLSAIFDDEWTNLRKSTVAEVQTIINSLKKSSSTNMNCQERRLKNQQDAEKENLVQKFQMETSDSSGCQRNKQNQKLKKELADLEKSHNEQWAMILLEKMQKKVDEIERIYPKESKEVCVQTSKDGKDPEHMELIEEECGCEDIDVSTSVSPSPRQSTSPARSPARSPSKSDGDIKICPAVKSPTKLPDLNQLDAIEVNEMKELQKNLRQWQIARRSLMESINDTFKQ